MTREEIQSNAVKLAETHQNLILEWATSLGKTKTALDIVSKLPGNGFIILAEKSHIKNWKEEIIKFDKQEIFNRSEVFLYASLHKYKNREVDWIIYDEIHHGLSSIRQNIISSIKCSNNILLSATIDSNQLFELTRLFPKLKRDHISLNKAIEWGIIPKPIINLIPIKLKEDSYTEVIEIKRNQGNKFIECLYKERFNVLKANKDTTYNIRIKCTQKQKYEWFDENIEYWKKRYFTNRKEFEKNKWLQLGSNRKRFLAEIKTPYANELLLNTRRQQQRFICFTGSINQSNILGASYDVVHSQKKNNQETIDLFNSGKINSLFAVGMLREGLNLVDIEVGIIIQLDGDLKSYIQKSGRIFRSSQPIQYILYIQNTRDEEYLNNCLKGLEKYINIIQ